MRSGIPPLMRSPLVKRSRSWFSQMLSIKSSELSFTVIYRGLYFQLVTSLLYAIDLMLKQIRVRTLGNYNVERIMRRTINKSYSFRDILTYYLHLFSFLCKTLFEQLGGSTKIPSIRQKFVSRLRTHVGQKGPIDMDRLDRRASII